MDEHIPKITPEQFAVWKHSPVTQTVFKYLESYSKSQQAAHLDRWLSGEADQDKDFEHKARGVCLFVTEFLHLTYDELYKAYGEEDGK